MSGKTSFVLALATCLLPLTASGKEAARRLTDEAAGISFIDPFESGSIHKTGAQVEALVEKDGGSVPSGVKFTSGLYAKGGMPFLLVWIKPDVTDISQSALEEWLEDAGRAAFGKAGIQNLRFDKGKLRFLGDLAVSPKERDGVRTKVLIQVMQGQIAYVGFHYRHKGDLEAWQRLEASLVVVPARRLTWDELPRGVWWPGVLIAACIGGTLGGGAVVLFRSRRRRG